MPSEKVLLVALASNSKERWIKKDRLDELEGLVKTAGGNVFEKTLQIRNSIDPAYYIGKGKVREIGGLVNQFGIDTIVFDSELSPAQQRNLESALKIKIVDRTVLIMDIFALHAQTREAKLQVELAQLEYRLPRLTGKGIELSRTGGGIGTRGPGEKKLEVEKRRIKDRIAKLKKLLIEIEKTDKIKKKKRKDVIKISLIGYTNSGKSSIMNVLVKENLPVDNGYFSTLDATTRKIFLGTDMKAVLSDTVGFIDGLPPHLVASFKSTLSVIKDADLLLHIIDASHKRVMERYEIVESTLYEMKCFEKPRLTVFNKIDLLLEENVIERFRDRYPESVFVSALLGKNINNLTAKIVAKLHELNFHNGNTHR